MQKSIFYTDHPPTEIGNQGSLKIIFLNIFGGNPKNNVLIGSRGEVLSSSNHLSGKAYKLGGTIPRSTGTDSVGTLSLPVPIYGNGMSSEYGQNPKYLVRV